MMESRDIVIIGNGGFGREVLELIRDINHYTNHPFNILGFLNNDKNSWGQVCNGINILGDESFIDDHLGRLSVAIGIGSPVIKRKIVEQLKGKVDFPNLIHPSVIAGKGAGAGNFLGEGNLITAGNILTCNITIKNHVMLNLAGTVGHDVVIDDYVVVSPGVNISGNVNIGEGAYLGTGCTVLEKKNIGKWSVIGGAALVNSDIPDNTTAVGIPAKVIKTRDEGWHL